MRQRLLDAALTQVPKHGWSVQALSEAAVGLGLSPAAHGLAMDGPVELVRHFERKCNRAFAGRMQAKNLATVNARQRLRYST
jgi:rpsU-divergently transcribed protein